MLAAAAPASALPRVWDLPADYRTGLDYANPNPDQYGNSDTWSFMAAAALTRDPPNYVLLDSYNTICGAVGEVWAPSTNYYPYLGKSAGGVNSCNWLQQAGMVAHPADDRLVVVSWKSPISGDVSVAGSVTDWDVSTGDGISWFLDRGIDSLASGTIAEGGQQAFADGTGGSSLASVHVEPGQRIYLAIDRRGAAAVDDFAVSDDTGFALTITELAGSGGGPGPGPGPQPSPDTEPPTIDLRSPPEGAEYLVTQSYTADWDCSDAGSGVASCVGTVPDGLGHSHSEAGTFTFTVTATDNAGNKSEVTHTYTVKFAGVAKTTNGPRIVPDGSWLPSACELATFNLLTCMSAALTGAANQIAKAANWLASIWPARTGVGVVSGDGKPVGFQKANGQIIAVGAGNIIATGSGTVINVGAGNIIATGSGTIIATGSGTAVGCNRCQLTDAGGKIIAVGAGNIIAVGAGNIIAVGAGNLKGATTAATPPVSIAKAITHNFIAPSAGVATETLVGPAKTILGSGRVSFTKAGVRPLKLAMSRRGQAVLANLAAANVKRAAAHKKLLSVTLTATSRFQPKRGAAKTKKRTFKITPGRAA